MVGNPDQGHPQRLDCGLKIRWEGLGWGAGWPRLGDKGDH